MTKSALMAFLAVACSSLLCSCATRSLSTLPPDQPINAGAGRGGLLMVNVRLQDGEELPFFLDTGAALTVLNKSLEPKLGKRLGTTTMSHWGTITKENIYAPPKLSLGGIPMKLGNYVITLKIDHIHDPATGQRTVMGVIGYDCLKHYRLQMDFVAGKLRFLDDQEADKSTWGRAFPIVPLNFHDSRPSVAENLLGLRGPHSLIDSGCTYDGWLMPEHYQQWTNVTVPHPPGQSRAPHTQFADERYLFCNVAPQNVESDGIGLRFLARHLVTLDFPNQTMYLARQAVGPRPDPVLKITPVQALEPLIADVIQENIEAACRDLASLEKSAATELEKNTGRHLVATLQNETKPVPANAPSNLASLPLGDAQAEAAEVGWLKPTANRIPLNWEIISPQLESGHLYATGLYAHAPSRYAFDLGGKWKQLRGEAGLHTAYQEHAYGVVFVIKADGKELYRSGAIRGGDHCHYEVNVMGAKSLELIVEKAREQNGGNWALWLDPILSR